MQAIRTKYVGASSAKGSRIQVKCEARTIYLSYDSELDEYENHKSACTALVRTMGWDVDGYSDMVGGVFDNAHYWVFDGKRLQALRGMVNSMRAATWTGSPWSHTEFKAAVGTIGRAYDYHGSEYDAHTTDEEVAAWMARCAK